MAECYAPDSSSGVSDQQSEGSSPGRATCVLKLDILAYLLCHLDGTLSGSVIGSVHICKRTQNTHHGRG